MAGRVPQAALRAASHPSFLLTFVSLLAVLPAARIGCHAWGHDGHAFTCAIAQALLTDEAAAAVATLLPPMARGSLPAVCSWADVIAHTKGWGWSSPLHYIDTPDFACSYDEPCAVPPTGTGTPRRRSGDDDDGVDILLGPISPYL
ncbi:unnamed protein product [Closterium sp. NIES-54]